MQEIKGIVRWTNSHNSYQAKAKLIRENAKTFLTELLEESDGYHVGHRISVPIYGTQGNCFIKGA